MLVFVVVVCEFIEVFCCVDNLVFFGDLFDIGIDMIELIGGIDVECVG